MFKIGDKVRCVDNEENCPLTIGKVYTILEICGLLVYVENDNKKKDGFFPCRFKLVEEPTTINCYTDPDFTSKMPLGLHLENPHGTLTKVRVTIEKVEESKEEKLVGLGLDIETVGKIMEIFNEV